MSKRHATAKADPSPANERTEANTTLKPWLKGLLSLLLVAHVLAVITPPFGIACRSGPGPEGTSPIANLLTAAFEPYYQALYLDHGYFFFAPTVGPTHLADYEVEFADGRPPVKGRFPDLAAERPRLLYHRHFMMSEALNNMYVPPKPPLEPSPPPLTASDDDKLRFQDVKRAYLIDLAEWNRRRPQYESMRQAFEQHLLAAYGGSKVTLTRVEHRQSVPFEVSELHKRLNDPATYTNLPETPPTPLPPRGN
jgi:hypothetical protein